MIALKRRALLGRLAAVAMLSLSGCGREREVVVGPNASGSKRDLQSREPEKPTGRRGRSTPAQ
jgi:hypothetical protein